MNIEQTKENLTLLQTSHLTSDDEDKAITNALSIIEAVEKAKVPEEKMVGYVCSHCGNWLKHEAEIMCWKCGLGEMIFENENEAFNQALSLCRNVIAKRDLRIKELERSVKEWICTSCNTVFPGFPSNALADLTCPKCDKIELVKRDSGGEVSLLREKIKDLEEAVEENKIRLDELDKAQWMVIERKNPKYFELRKEELLAKQVLGGK